MNRLGFPFIALLIGLCLSLAARAEPLSWVLLPLAGVVELEEGRPLRGVQVEALELLEQYLPDMQTSYRTANFSRVRRDMANGLELCAAPFLRDSVGQEAGYFVPFLVATPIQMVIRRADLERFPVQNGRVSLQQTLTDRRLNGGLSVSRTYPREIRGLLQQGLESSALEWISGPASGDNVLLMISAGRLDYGFEFGTVFAGLSKDPRLQAPLLALPMEEGTELEESGIHCTRGAWGERMAQRLDEAVRELASEPEALLEVYRRHMPAASYAAYAGQIADYYRARAQRPSTRKE